VPPGEGVSASTLEATREAQPAASAQPSSTASPAVRWHEGKADSFTMRKDADAVAQNKSDYTALKTRNQQLLIRRYDTVSLEFLLFSLPDQAP
jgi:hypothetical protein